MLAQNIQLFSALFLKNYFNHFTASGSQMIQMKQPAHSSREYETLKEGFRVDLCSVTWNDARDSSECLHFLIGEN